MQSSSVPKQDSEDAGLEETLEIYLKQIDFFPLDVETRIACARLYLKLNQSEKGMDMAKKALEIDAVNTSVCMFFAEHYVVTDIFPAFQFLNSRTVQRDSGFLYRAFFRYEEERYTEMLLDANNSINLSWANSDALFYRALAYFSLGESEPFLSDINAAIKQDPDRLEFYLLRARYHNSQHCAYKMLRDFMAVTRIHEEQGEKRWKFVYDLIQRGYKSIINLIKEYDDLKGKSTLHDLSPDEQARYENISGELKSRFAAVGSLDGIYEVRSLLTTVGLFVHKHPELLEKKSMLNDDLQKILEALDKRVIPSYPIRHVKLA